MKTAAFILSLFPILLVSVAYPDDFRPPRWGIKPREVRLIQELKGRSDPVEELSSPEKLCFRGDVSGRDALIFFDFHNGGLYGVRIFFLLPEDTPRGLLDSDYDRLKRILNREHGPPAADHPLEAVEGNDASVIGHFSAWYGSRSKVYLVTYCERGKVRLLLGYTDRDHLPESSEELVDLYSVID